jgi:starch synthase
VEQKAPDVMLRAAEEVLDFHREADLCMLGDSEDPRLIAKLDHLAARFPGRVAIFLGYNRFLAAEIYAAGDFFLIPSRSEPCGLIDYIAQLNGNIPIVNQVGGLPKVIDDRTGITYFALNDRQNLRGLVSGMHRALELFHDAARLESMRAFADSYVRDHHTWDHVFPQYYAMYVN